MTAWLFLVEESGLDSAIGLTVYIDTQASATVRTLFFESFHNLYLLCIPTPNPREEHIIVRACMLSMVFKSPQRKQVEHPSSQIRQHPESKTESLGRHVARSVPKTGTKPMLNPRSRYFCQHASIHPLSQQPYQPLWIPWIPSCSTSSRSSSLVDFIVPQPQPSPPLSPTPPPPSVSDSFPCPSSSTGSPSSHSVSPSYSSLLP